MLDFKILNLKGMLNNMVDLFQVTFIYKVPKIKTFHRIKEFEVGRLDKICHRYYGNANYLDALMKYNEIQDAFTVANGDIILIPEIQVLENSYIKGISSNNVFYFNDKQEVKQNTPPNKMKSGKKNVVFKDGRMILGAYITKDF